MPEELNPDERAAGVGSKETIRPGEFEAKTLSAGEEITVWTKEVNQDQLLYHGYGVLAREYARAFVGLDVQSAAGSDITGDLHIAVEDSEGTTLAVTTFDDLDELRDSLNESRSDRIVEPAHTAEGDLAGAGRQLAIYLEADDSSDGDEVDPAESSGKMYYGKVQR
jgi:hypothetical protein